MDTPIDPDKFVHDFLGKIGTELDQLPDPFEYTTLGADKAKSLLPARLRGKLAQLHESETQITRRFAYELGKWTQECIDRKIQRTTCYDAKKREFDRNEEKERSAARENWYCGLPIEEKRAFDDYCINSLGSLHLALITSTNPRCLHGALARLALEAARIARTFIAQRAELQQSSRSRGNTNLTIMSSLIKGLFHLEEEANSSLIGRWLRQLTPEQEAALDGGTINAKPESPVGPAEVMAEQGDESAFRPAKEFLKHPFDTFAKVKSALRKNTWIRTQKPSMQRLNIHAGDWHRFLHEDAAAPVDPLDFPAEMVDAAVKEVETRKATERANRPKK